MSYTVEKTKEGVTTLSIKDQGNYRSFQVMASSASMKALEKYANAKFDSLSREERDEFVPLTVDMSQKKALSAAYVASQAKEFFETTKLPYMAHEVTKDKSVKRTYGFEQNGEYRSTEVDMPSKSKLKSFLKPLGISVIKASYGFQKALGEELGTDIMYDRELRRALDKNEVTLHPDNVKTAEFSLPRIDSEQESIQAFLDRQGVEQEKVKPNVERDGPGF